MAAALALLLLSTAASGEAGLDVAWLAGELPESGQGSGFAVPGVYWRVGLADGLFAEWALGYWSWKPTEAPPQQDPFGSDYREHGGRIGRARAGIRWSFGSLFASAGAAALQEREFWTERSNLGGGWYAWIRYYRRDTAAGPYATGGWRFPAGPVRLEASLTAALYDLEHLRVMAALGLRIR
jgi:hypothetical protein